MFNCYCVLLSLSPDIPPSHPVWKADGTHLPVNHGAPAEPWAWLDRVVMCLPVYTCCAEHPLTCTAGTDRQSHDNPAWRTPATERDEPSRHSICTKSGTRMRGTGWGGAGAMWETGGAWNFNQLNTCLACVIIIIFLLFYFGSDFNLISKT